mmetsp:Transcript_25359/g.55441  ORF Transcript_25359/g.55441 Transcript_25359/m.55441 type:complete len:203 (+) Transcript_25359:617-1225(+)
MLARGAQLRRHVAGGSDDRRAGHGAEDAHGEAEVNELDAHALGALMYHRVLKLDVAVGDAHLVAVGECLGELFEDIARHVLRHAARPPGVVAAEVVEGKVKELASLDELVGSDADGVERPLRRRLVGVEPLWFGVVRQVGQRLAHLEGQLLRRARPAGQDVEVVHLDDAGVVQRRRRVRAAVEQKLRLLGSALRLRMRSAED